MILFISKVKNSGNFSIILTVWFAKGTDLLVHEVVVAPDTLRKSHPKYPILAHQITPEEVAGIFSKVKPKLAVYSHIVMLYGQGEHELLIRTQANYSGRFVIGEDLMGFVAADTITIEKGIINKQSKLH